MGVSQCIEQALIQMHPAENEFAIVRRANGLQRHKELFRGLNVDCDLVATSGPHIAYCAAGVAALLEIDLRADFYFLFWSITLCLFLMQVRSHLAEMIGCYEPQASGHGSQLITRPKSFVFVCIEMAQPSYH